MLMLIVFASSQVSYYTGKVYQDFAEHGWYTTRDIILKSVYEPGCERMIKTDPGQVRVNLYMALRKIALRLPLVVRACADGLDGLDGLLKLNVSAYRDDAKII
jgi:hypothetical protein